MITIGAAAKASGISRKMIRYYEEIGLLPEPIRSDSGYRHYSSDSIQQLIFIKHAKDLGFSLPRINWWYNLHHHESDWDGSWIEDYNPWQTLVRRYKIIFN